MNAKRTTATVWLLGSALLLAACSSTPSAETPEPSTTDASTPEVEETGEPVESMEPFKLDVAFSASLPQVEKLPMIAAADALAEEGHEVTITYLQSDEDAVQAAARGDVDLAQTAAASLFASVSNGAPIRAIMGVYGASYVAVAPVNVTGPEGVDGLRLGIHAQVSSTTLYANVMLKDHPDVQPEYVIVPGSANRIQALGAGELDASIIQLTEVGELEKLAPGQFHVIHSFAEENPDLVGAVLIASTSTLDSRSEEIKVFLAEVLRQQELFYSDPSVLADEIVKYVPEMTPERGAELAELYTSNAVWPEDGGLTEDAVTMTGSVLQESELLAGDVPSFSDACTRKLLDAIL